jgi:hypothetical protein
MKVRISEGNLRFRLSPADLARLPEAPIALRLEIRMGLAWSFQLEVTNGPFLLESDGAGVRIHLPRQDALAWIAAKELEWHFEQASPLLRVAIEKDAKPNRF